MDECAIDVLKGLTKFGHNKRLSQSWVVPDDLNDQRVHTALLSLDDAVFPTATTSKNTIRKGLIILNGKVCLIEDKVKSGDTIGLLQTLGPPQRKLPSLVSNSNLPTTVRICFEDRHLAVVLKPQGMPVFSEKDSGRIALATVLCHQFTSSGSAEDSEMNYRRRPQPVHRLDRETGGLVLVAKTYSALRALTEAFVGHNVHKTYFSLVEGRIEPDVGTISVALDEKEAITHYQQKWSKDYEGRLVSFVELNPITGRKNQLRR